MDVVAQSGAVPGWVVGAGNFESVTPLLGRHHQLPENVRRLAQVRSVAQVGIGADRIEIAQDQRPQPPCTRQVGQHRFRHEFGSGVRRLRIGARILENLEVLAGRVHRGRGGEDHSRFAKTLQLIEELQRLGYVVR